MNQLPVTAQASLGTTFLKSLELTGCTVLILDLPMSVLPPPFRNIPECLSCDQALGFLHKSQYDRNLL